MNTPTLTNITSTLGSNKGGLKHIQLCPMEWLANAVVVHPETRIVTNPIAMKPGKVMLTIKCQSETLEYTEKPKDSGAGSYYEQEIRGIVNLDDQDKNLQFDTLRLHRLFVLVPDKNNLTRVIAGEVGMSMRIETIIDPEVSGKTYYNITMKGQLEHAAPFYQPV